MPRDVKCSNCCNLFNDWCEKINDSPHPDLLRDCQYFRQLTNADRMMQMIKNHEFSKLLDWWEEIFENGVPSADYMAWWMQMEFDSDDG